MLKKYINFFLNYIGYKISKNKIYSFDHIYSYFLKNPLIIDVGSNEGQSIDSISKIFRKLKIHCFEPETESFKILKKYFFNCRNRCKSKFKTFIK